VVEVVDLLSVELAEAAVDEVRSVLLVEVAAVLRFAAEEVLDEVLTVLEEADELVRLVVGVVVVLRDTALLVEELLLVFEGLVVDEDLDVLEEVEAELLDLLVDEEVELLVLVFWVEVEVLGDWYELVLVLLEAGLVEALRELDEEELLRDTEEELDEELLEVDALELLLRELELVLVEVLREVEPPEVERVCADISGAAIATAIRPAVKIVANFFITMLFLGFTLTITCKYNNLRTIP